MFGGVWGEYCTVLGYFTKFGELWGDFVGLRERGPHFLLDL